LYPLSLHDALPISSALRPYVAMSQRPLAWLQSRRLTRRCSERWTHKVLGRGRSGAVLEQVMRARVLIRLRPVAELSSWATLRCPATASRASTLHRAPHDGAVR